MVAIDAKMIGVFVGGIVIGLVGMYFGYEKLFLNPAEPQSVAEYEARNETEAARIQELEDEVEGLKADKQNLTTDLDNKKKKLKKTSRERWGVIAGLGGLGLAIFLYQVSYKLKGGKTSYSKAFGFHEKGKAVPDNR